MRINELRFYNESVPGITQMVEYQGLVRERHEIYSYIERYKQLPVRALLQNQEITEDTKQHYAAKISAATGHERLKDFIIGETSIFRLRVDRSLDKDVLRLFLGEYLGRLQSPFVFRVNEGVLTVEIDGYNENGININTIGELVRKSDADEVLGIYLRGNLQVQVVSHFTKYFSLREKTEMEKGLITAGIEGIKSILVRGFEDTLRQSTQLLYISGVPKVYVVEQPIITVESMKLQERSIPRCISGVLDRLKTNRHLKYDDRSILNNFLKAAGVPLEDAIALYRSNFSCSASDFEKKYKYSIQHAYGTVGGRINYKGILCSKIISDSKKGGCNLCPFSVGMNPQRECTKTLEVITGQSEVQIASPSEYYLKAVKSISKKE
ncbi:DNA primase large subunit [Nematocida ausubeli]|nr:DNA primase large subunit [Nematocida ausubeli]